MSADEDGPHADVIERVRWPGTSSREAAALICALSFVGQVEDAKALFNETRDRLKPFDKARSRFSVALAFTRLAELKTARILLKENRDDPACAKCPEVFQDIGIYLYYTGHFRKAALVAKNARAIALKSQNLYILAFATDLLGHALVQSGERSEGLRLLRQASQQAKSMAGLNPLEAQRLIYEAEAGLRPESIVSELKSMLGESERDSFYLRSDLVLELGNQLTLRGHFQEARALRPRSLLHLCLSKSSARGAASAKTGRTRISSV